MISYLHVMVLRHLAFGLWVVLMLLPREGSGQYLSNPSFEGPVVMHQAPPGWNPCDPRSTPDTQPGVWGHTTPASNGRTYLSMVTRGDWGPNANSAEDCQAELLEPLSPNQCYELKVSLATCEDCGHSADIGWISYAQPVMLNIYLGRESCSRDELITTLGPVSGLDWETYRLNFSPSSADFRYIILEADWAHKPEYFGTIIIDDLRLSESTNNQHIFDLTLELGDTIRLDAGAGDRWLWSPAAGLSCSDCPSPLAEFSGDITYTVLIKDSSEVCPWYQSYRLWEVTSVFIPNAFTPDGDGLNDRFGPIFSASIVRMRFTVFDRFGMQVFSTTDPLESWDGTLRGEPAGMGVYPWVLEYGVHVFRGWQNFRRTGKVMVVR